MITTIKVLNRFNMNLLVDGMIRAPLSDFAIISIYSLPNELLFTPQNLDKIKKLGCSDVLSLLFWDIDPLTEKVGDAPIFTETHAQEVRNYLDKINCFPNDVVLLVHCDAGISRSGAVATFASNYFNIDFQDEYIKPNPYVLRILNNLIWNEKYQG